MTVYGTPSVGNARPVILKFVDDPQVTAASRFRQTLSRHLRSPHKPHDGAIGDCASTNVMVSRTDVTGQSDFTLGLQQP